MSGCIRRTKQALVELTDKTLPEEDQLKILNILTQYYDSYSQFHSIDSRITGDVIRIDIQLSFDNNTRVEEVVNIQKQIQDEFNSLFGKCIVKITMGED